MNYEALYRREIIKHMATKKKLQDAEKIIKEKTIIIERIREQVSRWRP